MLKSLEEKRLYFAQSLETLLANPAKLEGYRDYQRDALRGVHHSLAHRQRTRSYTLSARLLWSRTVYLRRFRATMIKAFSRKAYYIQLPTSAGKTEIMLAMILALCGTGQDIPRMFIVEPTKRLV